MDDPRIDPPLEADERATLTAFLDFNGHADLLRECLDGVTGE